MTIAVTPEMAGRVKAAVEVGECASVSEVFREALRPWQARQAAREREIEKFRRLWQEGLASGAAGDGTEAFGRLRQRFELGN